MKNVHSVKEFKDKFQMFELREENTNSWVKVCPERGGIITSFGVNGEEILYLDKDTFYNAEANIRGGIPILFPICGQLKEGKYNFNGKTYFMKNHGVARINSWEVMSASTDNEASIKLALKSNVVTEKSFPFKFELIFTYVLKDGKLTINQEYKNNSNEPMLFHAGFHPYFKAISKNIKYDTDASKYLDYNDMKIKEYNGSIDLSEMVESAAFLDASKNSISFELPGLNRKIILEYGKEFKYLVLWSVKDREFICVEPWTAKNEAFNTGEGLIYIEPKNKLSTYFTIQCKL